MSASTALRSLLALDAITRLQQSINSELNSRASFALSCLTLVMLGAALGILLRGKNPLAVFVVGFVPAIILVLLITAGRQLTESDPAHTVGGIAAIRAGNDPAGDGRRRLCNPPAAVTMPILDRYILKALW